MDGSFWAFLGVAVLVIVTPGPDTAVTIRNALIGGRRCGVLTGLGVAFGQSVWTLATSAGVVALLLASETLFLALKYVGAAYLCWLGAQALWAALRSGPLPRRAVGPSGRRLTGWAALRQGVVSDLGNPKMAAFFSSLLPQFAPQQDAFVPLLALGLVFAALTFLWLAAYAAVVASAGDVLRRPRVRRALEAVTGAVLIALGLRLAAEQR
jgi:threonine/homoserine/homoserine lactone efflux protein